MISVQRTFSVNKPVAEVIEYLADFGHAESWDPGTKSCSRIDDGPLKVGSTWHNVSVFRGRETELTYRLERRADDRLVFVGNNKTATSTDDMTFAGISTGTSITYHATIEFHGLARLVGPLFQKEFNRLGDLTAEQMPKVIDAL